MAKRDTAALAVPIAAMWLTKARTDSHRPTIVTNRSGLAEKVTADWAWPVYKSCAWIRSLHRPWAEAMAGP